ncbi:integrase, catalytic region, zinc finger, CCHC-type containing protein [Tanacetum coccineum]
MPLLLSGMFKINIEPISPRLKNNKDAHEVYIEKTIEYNDTLCGFVERARTHEKLVAVTPSNKDKRVRFAEPVTSSSNNNIPKHTDSLKTKDSNKPFNALVKHYVKNDKFESMCAIYNKWLFDANHDICLVDFVNDVNVRLKSKSIKKQKEKSLETYRITPKKIVCLKETTPKSAEIPKPDIKVYSRRPKQIKSVGSSKKAKIVYSNISNNSEPNHLWGSNATDVPSSSSFINDRLSRLSSGSHDTNLYTISLDDMLKTSPVYLLSKASKTKSWLWHRRLSHLNFGTLNKLAKYSLARGIPKLKFQKDHLCSACALGKSKKSSHQPKAEDTNQEKLYLLHMDLCGLMRVKSINGENEDLGKLNAKADIAMASKQFGSGPGLQVLTPATSSSGLVPNIIPQQPCNPPKRDDWDTLFQPLFDEYFNPSTIVVSTVPVAAAPRAVEIADSPVSTSIGQDAPSSSIPSTQDQEHSLIISQGVKESPKTPLFHDDPFHEFLHEDSTSQGLSSNVRPSHTLFELIGRWTKDHPIANVIGDPSCSVSTRKQLKTDAMWCYFDAFLTFVELKNFKQAITKPSWINAMLEEIHEFERL